MKSPRSAFPTWSTYIPDVGGVGAEGAVNYNLRAMYGRRSAGGGLMRSTGDMRRAAAVSAQELSTAAGIGAGVVQQISHRPILTAMERSRQRWSPADDVGDRPRAPGERRGEVLGPPNMPADVGARVGWVPEEPTPADPFKVPGRVSGSGILSPLGGENDPQNFDLKSWHAEEVAAGRVAPRRGESRSMPHGNPAASDTARQTRSAIDHAVNEVLSNPKNTMPGQSGGRRRRGSSSHPSLF
jgi:hypothetical protein